MYGYPMSALKCMYTFSAIFSPHYENNFYMHSIEIKY